MEQIFNHLVKENEPYYDHVLEGPLIEFFNEKCARPFLQNSSHR